ncbi:hypothetical protein P0D69_21770 [Paraburkholderia sediminicola]|uniref:hypothetical protein n=1 Tax=Paraburkholderia sediminicola TaxID=458836 RepID=UPI0038B8E819
MVAFTESEAIVVVDRKKPASDHVESGVEGSDNPDFKGGEDTEQRAALLEILAMGQRDIEAGNYCDADEFFNEMDVDD